MAQDFQPQSLSEPRFRPATRAGSDGGRNRQTVAGRERTIATDLMIGALAGAAGVWVMDRLDWFNYRHGLDDAESRAQTRRARPLGMDPAHLIAAHGAEAADVTLSFRQHDRAGLAVHYVLGIVPGALYGALRGRVPHLDAGRGSAFGVGLFLIQDELLNTAAGLAGPPQDYPWQAHARGLLAHLTYGLVTDALCRLADAGQNDPARPDRALRAEDLVRYHPDVEQIEPGEEEVFEKIIAVMRRGNKAASARHGRALRASHAKAHGLVRGELQVLEGLPPELRQGIFAASRSFPTVVRLSHVPGEILDDRKVSNPRGMALKIFDVEGEMLPGDEGERTQDWILDTGKVFIAPGAKTFLAQITATEAAIALPEGVKSAVSTAAQAANQALHAVGLDSANLDFYGHPALHPLGEAYYSQCPIRFGDYIAKLAVIPDNPPALRALVGRAITLGDEDALRHAVQDYFRVHPAEYIVAVQLCTDLDRVPVENANVEWPEDESPYRPVARLILPPQEVFSRERQEAVDDGLSFCPAHSLAAHRPLGSIMRARMQAYEVLGRERLERNG